MRRALAASLLILSPALLSAADPLTAARAEADAAEREQARLEARAKSAEGEAARLQARQAVGAQGIVAAEALLAEAEVRERETARRLELQRRRLAQEERPAALLLAGVAQIGRRPPLLALADARSVNEIVHLRALLNATVPALATKTAALRRELRREEALAVATSKARTDAANMKQELSRRQRQFAALEAATTRRLAELGTEALSAGDVALARRSEAEVAAGAAAERRLAARNAAQLALLAPPVPRPSSPAGDGQAPAINWSLPLVGPVQTGLAEISPSGVRSRGLTIAARRGAPLTMPADGRIAFSGPFRRHPWVIVLDHGEGWMTLLTGARSQFPSGSRLRRGEPLGRALGSVTVELSRDGRPQPAALIAGSYAMLSNGSDPS